jgi:hypothetical protein
MAIRIQAAPDWLSASPLSGTILPGASQDVDVTFDATDLFGGLYSGGLDITTNDPLASLVHIPATLLVTGAPDIAVAPTSIDFGTVYVGYPQLREFTVTNEGTDVLTLTGISSSNPEFSGVLEGGSFPIQLAPLTPPCSGRGSRRPTRGRRPGTWASRAMTRTLR